MNPYNICFKRNRKVHLARASLFSLAPLEDPAVVFLRRFLDAESFLAVSRKYVRGHAALESFYRSA